MNRNKRKSRQQKGYFISLRELIKFQVIVPKWKLATLPYIPRTGIAKPIAQHKTNQYFMRSMAHSF
jgi:hypothetical protein